LGSQDAAYDTVFEAFDVEVDEQRHLEAREPEIGEKLRFVDRLDSLDGLQFEDDAIVDDDVEPVSRV
jgi:hypothetical protein